VVPAYSRRFTVPLTMETARARRGRSTEWRRRARVAVALATVPFALLAAGVAMSATADATWTGHWSFVDHCTGGGCSGNTYYWDADLVQTGSAITGTGGYSVQGTASGLSASLTASGYGGYVAQFHVTMSADGKSVTGTATDTQGQSFTITGTGPGQPSTGTPTATPTATATATATPVATTAPPTPTAAPTGSGLPLLPPATNPTARMLDMKSTGPKGTTPSMTVRRDGKDYAVGEHSTFQNGDVLTTDDHTVAALEFLIGGRVGINKSTNVEMVNERSVKDGETSLKRLIMKNGSLWMKADASALKQPIEIQTNGGTMGIRG
jgi:hypothetical protein